jgi:hypothetical protein
MAVDIIPKAAEKTPLWQSVIFYFSIFLLAVTMACYFWVGNSLKKANDKSDELKRTIDKGNTEEQIALEKRVFSYKYRIDSLKELLDKRFVALNFFDFLEKNTRPEIWLKGIKTDPQKLRAAISGEGESFQTVGQQIAIFKNSESVKNLKINKISIDTSGKINFDIDLSFNNQFFKK